MGFQFEDGEVEIWKPADFIQQGGGVGGPTWWHSPLSKLHIEAHNAEFERAIWETIMVPQYSFTKDVTWSCTAARAAALALPRALDDVNRVLGLSEQKDKEGHFLMMEMCKPRKPTKKDPRENWLHDEEKLQRLYEYCKQDVVAEVALSKAIRKLNAVEQQVWEADQEINKRGIAFDAEFVQGGMALWEEKKSILNQQISEATGGAITSGSQHKRFLMWAQKWYPDLESVGKDPLKDLLARDDVPQELRDLFVLRAEVNKTSNAKFKALWMRRSDDGRVRSMFMYHGASTGRWTGKATQLHNLPSGRGLKFDHDLCVEVVKRKDLGLMDMLYPNSMSYLSACIRQCFVPKPGHKFVCADYSAIEARVLLWLVGDPGIEIIKQADADKNSEVDIYKDLASKIYNKPVEGITEDERQLGKQGILGLGYRMGVDRFRATCHQYGIEIDHGMAERVVQVYRDTYGRVRQFWDDVEATAMQCIRTRKPVRCGRVVWGLKDKFLHCSLPSGRLLSYHRPSIKEAETPWGDMREAIHFYGPRTEGGWGFQHSHGGVFTENIVQAIARDLLAEAIVRLEAHNTPVVLHVHDEVLCEVPSEAFIEEDMVWFDELVSRNPSWAPDLPIAVESWRGDRYRK
jgi:DNA polymerase